MACLVRIKRGKRLERGTAIIELAIVAPALIIVILSAFDLGQLIRNYFVLASTVREAVRQGGNIAYMEPGEFRLVESSGNWSCSGVCPSQHKRLLYMAKTLLLNQGSSMNVDYSGATITSTYDPTGKTLRIETTVKYRGVMLPFSGFDFSADATGPYNS